MPQTIKRVVQTSSHAYEIFLSDFEDSWHVMVVRLPDALGAEARGLTLFEGLYETQDLANEAAEQFLNTQGGK